MAAGAERQRAGSGATATEGSSTWRAGAPRSALSSPRSARSGPSRSSETPREPGGARSSDPQEVQAAALSHANRAPVTARKAAAALMDVDECSLAAACTLSEECFVRHGFMDDVLGGGSEMVAPAVRADSSIDWRPVMAHPPPLFSPTGWGSHAYDFLQVPPPPGDEDMESSSHGASASLWSFDPRDSYFKY